MAAHQEPEPLPIGVPPIEHADDAAFVHHRDAVADQQHLVEVVGDQQHRATAVASGQEGRLHVLGGVDVEATRRVHRDERCLGHERLAVDDQPLLVPAGEDARHRDERRRLDTRSVDQSPSELDDRRALQHERSGQVGAAIVAEDGVVTNGGRADESGADAVLGDVADSGVGEAPRRCVREPLPGHDDVPVVDSAQPGENFRQLGLAVARHAGDPQDLATSNRQAHLAQRGQATRAPRRDTPQLHDGFVGGRVPMLHRQLALLTRHQRRQLAGGHTGGGPRHDVLAVAQHRDPVADLEHLVELVGDEHDRSPGGHEVAHHAEQLARLGRGEHGGGLVEDQCSGPPSQHPQDLHPLLLADRELPDLRFRIDAQPELVHQAVGACHQVAAGDTRRGRVPSEVDVLRHGHRRHEAEVLVHHPDARGDGLGGGVELVWRSFDLDVAGVGAVDAGEDVAQRRLARAVLAEERMDFAAAQLEVDVAQRQDPVEALRDVTGPDGRDVGRTVDAGHLARRRAQPSTPDTPSTAQSIR